MYIDSHTHFNEIVKKQRGTSVATLIENLKAAGLKYVVQIAIDTDSFQLSYDLAVKYQDKGVFFTLGIQPSCPALDTELTLLDTFVERAFQSDKHLLFGIGECGLDYYRMRQDKMIQMNSFQHQLYLAKKYQLPVIIHTREATEDTHRILKEYAPVWGLMHCFPGNKKDAQKFLDLGFYISFAGNVTYKNAYDLHEAAAYVPLDRLLTETDAPYLTPEPLRGKTNAPEYIIHTYQFLADLRKEPVEKLQEAVLANFEQILKRRYTR